MTPIRLKAYAMIAILTLVRLFTAIAIYVCEGLLDTAPLLKIVVVMIYLFCIRLLLLMVGAAFL